MAQEYIKLLGIFAGPFLAGAATEFVARSIVASSSDKNSYQGFKSYVATNWRQMFVRFSLSTFLWTVWVVDPGLMSKIVKAVTVGVIPDDITNWITITPNLGSSYVFGLSVNKLLDYAAAFVKNSPKFSWLSGLLQSDDENPKSSDTEKDTEK